MRSLTEHFRDAELHDRLPFHPSCPIYRQNRLNGTFDRDGLMSMRTEILRRRATSLQRQAAMGGVR